MKADAGIEALYTAWRNAMAARDVDAVLDLLTPDYLLYSPGAKPVGREALRPMLAAAFAAYEIDPSFEREEQIVSGDIAFERGWDVQRVVPRAGGEAQVRRQRVFLILRRGGDDVWRFARGMSQPGPSESLRSKLVGQWTLLSFEIVNGAEVDYPMGRDVSGVITYGHTGQMTAQLMQRNRPPFASDEVAGATLAELSAAMSGYTAYFGTYSVDEVAGIVTHHVTGSLFPNWVGTEQPRKVVFDGDQLTLSSQPILFKGQMRVFRAVWKRKE